jgi:hypothetical protein
MAAPKYSRIGERSSGPSSTLIIVGSLLVGALLIGAWVLTSPAAIPDGGDEGTAMNTADTKIPVQASDIPDTTTEEDTEESPAEETVQTETPAEKEAEPAPTEDTMEEESASTTSDENTENAEENVEEKASETVEEKDPETVEEKAPETVEEKAPETVEEKETESVEEEGSEGVEEKASESVEEKASEADDSKLPGAINPGAELNTDDQELNTTKFETQAEESQEEKVVQEEETAEATPSDLQERVDDATQDEIPEWKLCSFEGAQDYIPCLDNKAAIEKLTSTKHYQHRERHCPTEEELTKCLLPLPSNYKIPIKWPESRDAVRMLLLKFFLRPLVYEYEDTYI